MDSDDSFTELENLQIAPDAVAMDCHDESNDRLTQHLITNEPSNDKNSADWRLGGRPPLQTILYLAYGLVIAQFTSALLASVQTIWVSKAIGENGMTAIGVYGAFDGMGRSLAFLVSAAGSKQIASLIAQGKSEEAAQVVCDLIRVAVVLGLLVFAILGPSVQPIARWYGAKDDVVHLGWVYMLPIMASASETCMFIGLGGCLQGEGRSAFFAVMSIGSSVLNMAILQPILLMVAKIGIIGASLSTVIAEFIPVVIILIGYFSGKFSIKPQFRGLCKCFSSYTWPALTIGMSQAISNLSQLIPSVIVRKLVGSAALRAFDEGKEIAESGDEVFNSALAAYNVLIRIFQLTNAFMLAVSQAFLPAGSYAYSRENWVRWLWLAWHQVWMAGLWGVITSALTWTIPHWIARIYSSVPRYLEWAPDMIRIGNAFGFCVPGRFCGLAILQSQQAGVVATIVSLTTQLGLIIVFALIFYYTNKADARRLMWSYSAAYAVGVVLVAGVLVPFLRGIWKKHKDRQALVGEEEGPTLWEAAVAQGDAKERIDV